MGITTLDTKTYVIRSQKLAGFLMVRGFKLHSIEPCNSNPHRNVFLFTMSDELIRTIKEYKNQSE